MKIEVHAPDGPDLTIPLPNALLFSSALWNGLLKISSTGKATEKVSPAAVKQACRVIKDYTKKAGSWELVRVESTDGATVIITI